MSIEKWVDLSGLPKKGNHINWEKSIGYKIPFKYMEVEGYIIIESLLSKSKVKISYDGNCIEIFKHNISKCKFGGLLKKSRLQFMYEIGDVVKFKNGEELEIIGSEIRERNDINNYTIKDKYYKCKCLKCNGEFWKIECFVGKSTNCPVCGRVASVVCTGINDIYTTDKWMVKYFIDVEDTKIYSHGSTKEFIFKCPHCNRLSNKTVKICTLYTKKYLPCSCFDGKSYPEKFLISVLDQLKINYIHQFSSKDMKWCGKYRYDFFLIDYNCIIETNGEQHYKDGYFKKYEEQKNIDIAKINLAKDNNINLYIRLDCQKSDMEFIKQSILNSELSTIFDIKNIDWLQCEKYAVSNRVKEVCGFYEINKEEMMMYEIVDYFKISKETLLTYLKKGNVLGWCNYDPCNSRYVKNGKKFTKGKMVEVIETGDVFKSVVELSSKSKEIYGVEFSEASIYKICSEKLKYKHKGFTFRYIK